MSDSDEDDSSSVEGNRKKAGPSGEGGLSVSVGGAA